MYKKATGITKRPEYYTQPFENNKEVTRNAILRPRHTSCCLVHDWRHCRPLQAVCYSYKKIPMTLHSDASFASQLLVTNPKTHLQFCSHSPAPHHPPCPLAQTFLAPIPRALTDPGTKFTYAIPSIPLLLLPLRPPFLRVRHPPHRLRVTLQPPLAVKDPVPQHIFATPQILLLLRRLTRRVPPPPPTLLAPVHLLPAPTFQSLPPPTVNHQVGQATSVTQPIPLVRRLRLAPPKIRRFLPSLLCPSQVPQVDNLVDYWFSKQVFH